MANISEEISQMGADLLLKALQALGQLSFDAIRLISDVGKDGAATIVGFMNYLNKEYGNELDGRTRRAMHALAEKCEKDGTSALKITVAKEDLPELEKWLKKQEAHYVACTPKKKELSDLERLSGAKDGNASQQTSIFFTGEDAGKVQNAVAICAFRNKLINILPPEAFVLLYDKKDISVIDGLNFFELNVFRELAKKAGVGYAEMANKADSEAGALAGTYKIVCGKEYAERAIAVMRLVSWLMTGEMAEKIKEKVLEREMLPTELERLMDEGVSEGTRSFVDEKGRQVAAENAKYVVNTRSPYQYVKVTPKGFQRVKGDANELFVAKNDPQYDEKLEAALSELGDWADNVIIDALEWEQLGLENAKLRKEHVAQRVSVFPSEQALEKEEAELRKARRKHVEQRGSYDEPGWLYQKFNPDRENPISELVEENYETSSKPLGTTINSHYDDAVKHAAKYQYSDIESDERTVDSTIEKAKGRGPGNEPTKPKERETVR